MKPIFILSLLACAGLQAATISLTASSGSTFSGGGVSVTVKSYSSLDGTTFSGATLQNFGSGLGIGVCSSAEVSLNQCNADDWQFSTYVDNVSGNGVTNGSYREFLLFTFDQNVSVQNIIQLQSSTTFYDNDFQWWYSTSAITSLTSLGSFTSGGTYDGNGMSDPVFGAPYTTNTATINTSTLRTLVLAIGQSASDTSDKFKLNALNVSAGSVNINSVPEPGSMALLGGGLLGLGMLARRRKQ